MMPITDFHTHAFPDDIADDVVSRLEESGDDAEARIGGRMSDLLASMDRHGIARSVLLNIATKPSQYPSILRWCEEIATNRIVPFPSVHPDDPAAGDRIHEIATKGFRGIKLHPYYQSFTFDNPKLFPVYEAMEKNGLILLTHAGFDMAYPRDRIADPERIARIGRVFPSLTIIASHLGAWDDWEGVREHLMGSPVYLDVSYSLHILSAAEARELILEHGSEKILFGSDSPWADQGETLRLVRDLNLDKADEQRILTENAEGLLGPF